MREGELDIAETRGLQAVGCVGVARRQFDSAVGRRQHVVTTRIQFDRLQFIAHRLLELRSMAAAKMIRATATLCKKQTWAMAATCKL